MIKRYSRPEMASLWSDAKRYEVWLEVELAVCEAMEQINVVPSGTARDIRQKVQIDPDEISTIERETRHDVIAFLTHVERQAGPPTRFLHLGMTSSDVLDTSLGIVLRQSGQLVVQGLERLATSLKTRAVEHKMTVMAGRTHGIQAEPTTMGLAFLSFYNEIVRQKQRLVRAIETVSVGKIAGAVGVYGNIDPSVEAIALQKLGLAVETSATQVVARDRHAEFFAALAQVAASVERIALQIRHWQRTEVGEAYEPFGAGQKGSSAMPHKKNPILSENVCGLARMVRAVVQPALENVCLWHERDISHSSVERVIGPDATILVDFMLDRMCFVVEGLVVDQSRMQKNLDLNHGLIFSEAVMLRLICKGLRRQKAYEMVQKVAMKVIAGEGEFAKLLENDDAVSQHLTPDELREAFDLHHHLRFVEKIFQRSFSES